MTVSLLTARQARTARAHYREAFYRSLDGLEAVALDRPGLEPQLICTRVEQARAAAGRWWKGTEDE